MNEVSMRSLNLAFRFILEMLVLLALFLWGKSMSDTLLIQLLLGVAAPAVVMLVWGLFVAPKASRRLEDPVRLVFEVVIFTLAALAFGLAVSWIVALMFGAAVLISLALMFYFGQRGL